MAVAHTLRIDYVYAGRVEQETFAYSRSGLRLTTGLVRACVRERRGIRLRSALSRIAAGATVRYPCSFRLKAELRTEAETREDEALEQVATARE